MKVQLLYAGVGVAGFHPNRPPGDREGSWISHGLASVGASLQAAGHAVSLLDLRHLAGFDDLRARIEQSDAEVFGISVSSVDYQVAEVCALMLRLIHPKSKIMVGGIHPTVFPGDYDTIPVDTVVIGEGEIAAVTLVGMAERGLPWPKRMQGAKPDLSILPCVARDLFEYDRELSCTFAPDHKTPSVTMLAGRGCAFKCSYCQPAENAVFGHPYRIRTPGDVVAEMTSLHARYGYESATFWDDTFTFSRAWVGAFCDLYEASGLTASLAACSRADIVCRNEAMIERLASIGLDWLVIGLESGSQRILDLIDKGTTVEQNRRAVEICHKHGIKVFGTFMLGLPTETREEATATMDLIEEICPDFASPFYYTPIPGTGLYDLCKEMILPEARERTIARTGVFARSLRDVDYDHLDGLLARRQGVAA